MKNFLKEIGPIIAGFQLATYVVSFFGIGAFATWVLERWLPFTRWVWDTIISFLTYTLIYLPYPTPKKTH